MNHFLARLVDRARGTAPRIEPIIAPRFAPAPVTEIMAEIEAPAPVPSRKNETASRNEAPTRKIVRQEIEPPRAEEAWGKETAVAPDLEKLLVPQEILAPDQPESIVRRIGPEEITAQPAGNGARSERLTPVRRTTQPGSPTPAPSQASRNVVAGIDDPGHPTAARASRREPTRPNESHVEPPIIRVTIGRIEVRAETPTPPPRKTPSPSRPKLTLDAYLKERKEGRR